MSRDVQARRATASEAMDRYASGADDAFDDLYRELAPKLARYLSRAVREPSAIDDLLQQTFVHIHLSRGRFVAGSRVEPWAYAIARAVAKEWLRGHYRRRADELREDVALPAETPDALANLSASEIDDALRAELAGLSPKLREAFLLIRIDGFSHAEAASVLGIEASASKVRAHRAGVWLRDKLARFRPREEQG